MIRKGCGDARARLRIFHGYFLRSAGRVIGATRENKSVVEIHNLLNLIAKTAVPRN